MPIDVTCPHCKRQLNAPESFAGRRVKCPKCHQPIDVPAPQPTGDRGAGVMPEVATAILAERTAAIERENAWLKGEVARTSGAARRLRSAGIAFAGLGLLSVACAALWLARSSPGRLPQTAIRTPRMNSKIPVELSYPIVSEEEEYNPFSKKRNIDVKLNMKVSKDVLREIALKLKSQEIHQYERTFIFYYLPEPAPGVKGSPWAISHFNPTLEVQILGLDEEAEKSLRGLPITRGDELIGSWIIDLQLASHRVTIYREGDAFKSEELTPGRGRFETELTEVPSTIGRRFKKSKSIDQYEIDSSGVLRIYGYENEMISAARPMR